MLSTKWCILCRHTYNDENFLKVYKFVRNESEQDVVNCVGRACDEVIFCYDYMDHVLGSLYKDKHCYMERWVIFFLLRFLASYSKLRDNPDHYYPFSSFEELCIRMVVWRVLNTIEPSLSEQEENSICDEAIDKRNHRILSKMHLPSPFVIDITRTLCDAKALAHMTIRKKSK